MTQLDHAAVAAIRSAATSAAVGLFAALALGAAGLAVAHSIPLPRAAPVTSPAAADLNTTIGLWRERSPNPERPLPVETVDCATACIPPASAARMG